MKTISHFILASVLAVTANAEFSTWTRSDGKTAELDLISVADAGGEKTGTFKMRNGKMVALKASGLTEVDAKRLAEWKPAAAAPVPAASVFDDILNGNLLKVDGKSLKKFKPTEHPTKYYVFYYTASWCGPCQQYTPLLVEFYEKNKNDKFEIVVITSDQTEEALEKYAVQKKMPWPVLKMKDAQAFKKKFDHAVDGIPSVIVCELDGKNLGDHYDLTLLEKLVK